MKNMSTRGFGWIPDLPDQRDKMFAAVALPAKPLPPKIDLTKNCPAIYDQGSLGSCTANALGGAFEFEQMKQHYQNYKKTLEIILCLKIKSKEFTDFKNKLRNGKKIKVPLAVPINDVKIELSGETYPGIEKRFRNFIKRIKAHPNYTDKIGKELRIQ